MEVAEVGLKKSLGRAIVPCQPELARLNRHLSSGSTSAHSRYSIPGTEGGLNGGIRSEKRTSASPEHTRWQRIWTRVGKILGEIRVQSSQKPCHGLASVKSTPSAKNRTVS